MLCTWADEPQAPPAARFPLLSLKGFGFRASGSARDLGFAASSEVPVPSPNWASCSSESVIALLGKSASPSTIPAKS